MRTSILAGLAALCAASVARADDTKPPQISDVKAAARGGQVQVEARITDETGVLSAVCHHRAPGGKAEASPILVIKFCNWPARARYSLFALSSASWSEA